MISPHAKIAFGWSYELFRSKARRYSKGCSFKNDFQRSRNEEIKKGIEEVEGSDGDGSSAHSDPVVGQESKHYMTEQLLLSSLFVFTDRATRAASVKASFTPRFFMAEHSIMQVSEELARFLRRHTQITESFDSLGDLETFVVLDQGFFGLGALVVVILLS
jgi:hypothetical protein